MLGKLLDAVERVGNKAPHPAVIFMLLIGIVIVLSHMFYLAGASVTYQAANPDTHALEETTTAVRSLLAADGIRFMYTGVVQNFMSFTATGVAVVAILGVGVAASTGVVKALVRKLVQIAPPTALTYILVGIGILSSIAADAGYLVLIPLAAAAYLSVGRHPLAGLGASFAGVAAVYSVNLFVKPLDTVLTGITNDAIHVLNPNRSISLTANVYFSIASVILLTVVVSLVSDKIIEPRLGTYEGGSDVGGEDAAVTPTEAKGLKYALWGCLGVLVVFALLWLPPGAPLRNAETGALIENSPFMNGLLVFITLMFLAAGAAYGIGAGTIKSILDVIKVMEKSIAGLGGLIFLLFVISQFNAFFTYTNMGTVAAVKLGDALEPAGIGPLPLLVGFIYLVGFLDILMSGAITKWTIFAPIFVPLLMRLGVEPEATLAAYRVGDSPINSVTPLNAYFGLVVAFAMKYQKDAGVGTVIALMLPYVVVLLIAWPLLLIICQILGLPWGF